MANKKKTRYLNLNVKQDSFALKILGDKNKKHNFSDIVLLRKLLTNQKARILYALKKNKIKSIYHLAKVLGRDFKSTSDDLKLLERFGFIEFHSVKVGKRESLVPTLNVSEMNLIIKI